MAFGVGYAVFPDPQTPFSISPRPPRLHLRVGVAARHFVYTARNGQCKSMSISVAHRAAAAVYQRGAADHVIEKLRSLQFLPHWKSSGSKLRDELLIMFSELISPRLAEATRPLLVVVAGSTGAGKSTLVNSVLGREVTKAGVLRPTTRRPVLLHNPHDVDPAGPQLADEVEIVATDTIPRGLALIDSPDIDSVLEQNRERALKVLSGADLWLFVTTPTRYGDAVPWQVLAQAAQRDVAIAVVLNRTGDAEKREVRSDLARRLREAKLGTAPLFVIADAGAHHGLLSEEFVKPLRRWLGALAGSTHAHVIAQRSLRGALASVEGPLRELEEILDEQDRALAKVARRCATAEDQVRDRGKRPRAETEPASEKLNDAWRAHDDVWHLLNVPSGEKLKLRRKERPLIAQAFEAVESAINEQLAKLPLDQYDLLNDAVLDAVAEIELEAQWKAAVKRPKEARTEFDEWHKQANELATEWASDKSQKLRRSQTRALGETQTAQLLKACAVGLRGARALVGTIFGEKAIDAAEDLGEKLAQIQGEVTDQVVGAVQNQLVALLPMRKSGEQLAKARSQFLEVR